MVQKAMEVLNVLSQNDLERERYRARQKWERDQKAFIDEARAEGIEKGWREGNEKGLQEGLHEGLQQGLHHGEWIGRIQMSQELLGLPLSTKEELKALSISELQAKAKLLEQTLRSGRQ